MAAPILIYGLISVSAFVALLTPGPGGTLFGLVLIPGVGALYGAAAILQLEYAFIRSWRPGWGRGVAHAWFGGWALLTIGQLIREFRSGGFSAVGEFMPSSVVFGLFVLSPWFLGLVLRSVLASMRARLRRVH